MQSFLFFIGSICFISSQVAMLIVGLAFNDVNIRTDLNGEQTKNARAAMFFFMLAYIILVLLAALLWGLAR